MRKYVLALVAVALAGIVSAQTKRPYNLVITHANLVDVEGGRVLKDRLIAIEGKMIKAIDNSRNAAHYKALQYIDAKNGYIIPGLWDMHVHFRGGDSLIAANKKFLSLFLSYGVTCVRDCGGDITPAVLTWRREIAAGKLTGPRIYTSGPKLDGANATWPGSLVVETKAQVVKALDSLQSLHVDFVKLYDSKISRYGYLESISEAERRGMKTTGHMPFSVELKEAVERGLDASEHLFYVFKGCSSKEDSITREIQEHEGTAHPIGLFAALPALYASYDEAKAQQFFHYLASKHFTVLPTLFVSKTIAELRENDHAHDSLLGVMDPKIRATYAGRVNGAKRETEATARFMEQFEAKCASMVPAMYHAGVRILAGSDCGAYNSYVYPGASLHEELKLLVHYGLTPAQALRTATIHSAEFMGASEEYGSITTGKHADVLLLERNPLEDIGAIDSIREVVVGGRIVYSF